MSTRLVRSRKQLVEVVGEAAVREAEAWVKFPGQRTQRRATWDAYCYPTKDGWVVASLDATALRKAQWVNRPAVEAAERWADHLGGGGSPAAPSLLVTSVYAFPKEVTGGTLALDTEGVETVERVSVAFGPYAGTFPFDGPARTLLLGLLESADRVLLYYADHDLPLLADVGVPIDIEKVRDVMIAHTVVNPWRERGLGKAAPLYAPLQPWKGSADPEWYSAMDAWVLLPMWEALTALMAERRLEGTFTADQALAFRTAHLGCRPRWGRAENAVTKAAGLLEV